MNRLSNTDDLHYRVTILRGLKEHSFNEWLVIENQPGEKNAFTTLIKNWEQRYFLYALNRLKSPEAAKDVTQESLICISRPLNKLSNQANYPK